MAESPALTLKARDVHWNKPQNEIQGGRGPKVRAGGEATRSITLKARGVHSNKLQNEIQGGRGPKVRAGGEATRSNLEGPWCTLEQASMPRLARAAVRLGW